MNRLKFLRTEKNLNQYELALASGVPRYLIQLTEAGIKTPLPEQKQALATCLGVKISDLFPVKEK